MKNWLDQEIVPGAVVYRGARDGNTSSFKVGFVEKINEATGKVTVNWILEDGGYSNPGVGTPHINTLVLIDLSKQEVIDRAEVRLKDQWKNYWKRLAERPELKDNQYFTEPEPWW